MTSSGGRQAPKRSAPVAIGLARCTFVDTSRSTYNYLTQVSVPGRRLVTEIRYPTAHGSTTAENPGARPLERRGGYPVVVFADGYDVTPDVYRALLDAWVRAGFVVVAPLFPDTSSTAIAAQHGVLTENDNVNEPADLAFVTRQMAHASLVETPSCRVLHGLVSTGKAVLAGQSDGGQVVAALAYDNTFAGVLGSLSYKAVAVLSGDEIYGGTYTAGTGAPPMLVVQSNADACNPPQAATTLYNMVPLSAKWFLLLRGVHHLAPYDGTAKAAFAVVSAVTSRWFHLELAGATPTAGFLAYGNRSPAVAAMTTGPSAPPVPGLVFSKAACYLH